MSLLASYVEKFILNPATSKRPNIEDDGNEETRAFIADRIEGEEGAKAAFASVSKLRLQNAELLGDTDPRYKGQKTTRKKIKGKKEVLFDPELAKFCILDEDDASDKANAEDEDDNEAVDGNESEENDDDSEENDDDLEEYDDDELEENVDSGSVQKNILNKNNSLKDTFMRMAEDNEEYLDDEEDNECDGDDDESMKNEDDDDDDDEIKLSRIESNDQIPSSIKTFSKEDSIQLSKGIAVKNQCHIYDKLFEARIGMQKVAAISNQLPQANVYKSFLQNQYYPLYKTNLVLARKAVKKLMIQILELQECVLQNNVETKHILGGKSGIKQDESDKDSENSDEDESANEENEKKNVKGTKRKLEEFEDVLKKRHKTMIPFRNETLNTWFGRAKLLGNHSKGGFGGFDISPIIQIKNSLANKGLLIRKTQLKGIARGNVDQVLGKESNEEEEEEENSSSLIEDYDPEIFDDTGFYTTMLEDFLRSKISVTEDMLEVSRHWVSILKLRKKSKRKVYSSASKGKKLKHQVITKQQNFMAPAKHSHMSDDATNKLYTSLFGNNNVK